MKHRWFCHLLRRVIPRREGNRKLGNFLRGVTTTYIDRDYERLLVLILIPVSSDSNWISLWITLDLTWIPLMLKSNFRIHLILRDHQRLRRFYSSLPALLDE